MLRYAPGVVISPKYSLTPGDPTYPGALDAGKFERRIIFGQLQNIPKGNSLEKLEQKDQRTNGRD